MLNNGDFSKVLAVAEIMPCTNGLARNVAQCLEDYDIPLYLSHTVTNVIGKNRLEGVVISQVDENLKPIEGTEKHFECDTLLLSVGLVPENEITRSAGIEIDPRTNGAVVDENMQTNIGLLSTIGGETQMDQNKVMISLLAIEQNQFK